MRIAILGYGKEGQAALAYWGRGNEVTICDRNPDLVLPDNVQGQTGPDYLHNLDRFNLIIRSPQIHPAAITAANNETILHKVTTGTEEFMRNCPAPIIGVTGTKGKGTTSTLIARIVEAAGHKVHLGGNIGVAPLEMINWSIGPEDWVVLELSNFQLIDLRVSPKVAVCVKVDPEHLDWHADVAEYVQAKQNLFRRQSDQDLAVFNRLSDYSAEVAEVSPALKMSYEVPPVGQEPSERNGAYVLGNDIYMDDDKVCSVNDVVMIGRHNLENICAAITATWDLTGQNPELITRVIRQFAGLPHRIEPVRRIDEVMYYNDSFSAAGSSTTAAIEAIPQPKVVIVGGYDRGMDVSPVVNGILKNSATIRKVILIGQTGPKVRAGLDAAGYTNYWPEASSEMATIVARARSFAQPGDAVLLSPGFASFDMFKNFEDRGIQFKAVVQAL